MRRRCSGVGLSALSGGGNEGEKEATRQRYSKKYFRSAATSGPCTYIFYVSLPECFHDFVFGNIVSVFRNPCVLQEYACFCS